MLLWPCVLLLAAGAAWAGAAGPAEPCPGNPAGAAAGAWKWYRPEEGLPATAILCGTRRSRELWMGGEQCVFSLDPDTGHFRAYLPDVDLCGKVLLLEPGPTGLIAYTRNARYEVDPKSGHWRTLPPR